MRLLPGYVLMCLALASCGDPVTPKAPPAITPTAFAVLQVVCHEDGATEIDERVVAAQSDGVHIRVDNRAGEFISLNGTRLDFSEGITQQVETLPPGGAKIACWPGSMHRGPEPETIAVTVQDPNSYWVSAELQCPQDELIENSTLDYASDSEGTKGEPENIAREQMKGLEPSDRLFTAGYPEANRREVAVEREGEIVAILGYDPTTNGGWILRGYSTCATTDIDLARS